MNTTNEEKRAKRNVVKKSWKYLDDNFHKFSQRNKIKIALALCLKDMPEQHLGEIKFSPQEADERRNRLREMFRVSSN